MKRIQYIFKATSTPFSEVMSRPQGKCLKPGEYGGCLPDNAEHIFKK